jgi:hypothetical protein
MRHARLTAVLVCTFVLISTAALAAPPAAPGRTAPGSAQVKKKTKKPRARVASRCVTLAQETSGQTVDLSLTNRCEASMSCSVGWVVRCGQARRLTTHRGSESVWLADGSSQTVTASAAECGDQSWRVGAIRWSCNRD